MANDDNLPGENLPDPRPPLKHPPMMDLSFAALGWLCRAADAVGSIRFAESVKRTRFYLEKARCHAGTPAEFAVLTGLASSLQGLIEADAEARQLLTESLSEFDATFEAGCLPAECNDPDADPTDEPCTESTPPDSDSTSGIEGGEGQDVSQDPAA